MWPVASSVPTAKEEVHEVVPPLEVKEIQASCLPSLWVDMRAEKGFKDHKEDPGKQIGSI